MDKCVNAEGILKHEMALECGIIDILAHNRPEGVLLGRWDYISHQVVASPFKPVIYMDKMDVFGYRYIPNLPIGYETLSDFLIIELKCGCADADTVHQIMKYVDWVKQEYAFGDYSRIKAFIIASDYSHEAVTALDTVAVRNYTYGSRPARTAMWNDLTLLKYRYDIETRSINIQGI